MASASGVSSEAQAKTKQAAVMPPAAAKMMRHAQPQFNWHYPPHSSLPLSCCSLSSSLSLSRHPASLMNTQFMPSLSLHCNAISHSAKLKANLLPVCRKFFSPALHLALFTLLSAAAASASASAIAAGE